MSRVCRSWTTLEVRRCEALRRSGLTLAAVARELGRTARSVSSKLRELGVPHPTRAPLVYGRLVKALARLCRPGVSDADLGRKLRSHPSSIRRARVSLGRPAGIDFREAGRRAQAACRRDNDGLAPAVLRWQREHVATFRAGWPVGCTLAAAAHLERLRLAGRALTLGAWAALAGLEPKSLLQSVRKFARLGWVAREPCPGRARCAYRLAPAVLARRERYLAWKAEDVPA